MNSSVEVDSLEILVIVDNVVDPLSSNPPWVEPELRGLLNRGRIRMLSGSSICCGHHGLSLLLKAQIGDVTQTLLFDTGAERQNFERNSKILDVDFSAITDIVLSHGHWDHAGGMEAAVEQIVEGQCRSNESGSSRLPGRCRLRRNPLARDRVDGPEG